MKRALFILLTATLFNPIPAISQAADLESDSPRRERAVNAGAAKSPRSSRPARPRSRRPETIFIGVDAVVREGQRTDGLVVIGGNATVEGTVNGGLMTVFGNARLGPSAGVSGDVTVVGGVLDVADSATIGGRRTLFAPGARLAASPRVRQWLNQAVLLGRPLPHQYAWSWVLSGLLLLMLAGIATVMRAPTEAALPSLEGRTGAAFLAGLLTFALCGPLFVLLAISGIGLLVIPFVLCGLAAALLLGLAAVYRHAGQHLAGALHLPAWQRPLPALFAGGLFFALLYVIPFVGTIALGALAPLSVGAVLLALFKRDTATAAPTVAPVPAGALPPVTDNALLPRVGFWRRLGATALDLLLIAIVLRVFQAPKWFLPVWLLYHLAMWSWRGVTLGDIILDLRLVRQDGRPVNFGVALVRLMAGFFSAAALFLGFFWAGWSREKLGWHDKIAGTMVVRFPRGARVL